MKLHLRADSVTKLHTTFTVFMNGANCGQLCMSTKEALFFRHRVLLGDYESLDEEVTSSGAWTREEEPSPQEDLSYEHTFSGILKEKEKDPPPQEALSYDLGYKQGHSQGRGQGYHEACQRVIALIEDEDQR